MWIIFSLVPLREEKYPSYTPVDIILRYVYLGGIYVEKKYLNNLIHGGYESTNFYMGTQNGSKLEV